MLAFGGDLRKGKAAFGNGGRTFNRANFQEIGNGSLFPWGEDLIGTAQRDVIFNC
jgi:hypothetical protein